MSFINLLFSVRGRINRAKWWLAIVFWMVLMVVAPGAIVLIFAQDIAGMSSALMSNDTLAMLVNSNVDDILYVLTLVPMILSSIFIGIKRLHDRNKSGWWLVLFYFGASVLQGIGSSVDSAAIAFVFLIAGFAIAIWGLVELGFLRGTPGPNQYGPDPLASQQVAPQAA